MYHGAAIFEGFLLLVDFPNFCLNICRIPVQIANQFSMKAQSSGSAPLLGWFDKNRFEFKEIKFT
jgi:hypothetical protein